MNYDELEKKRFIFETKSKYQIRIITLYYFYTIVICVNRFENIDCYKN